MSERFAVVDDEDRFLYWADRRTIHANYLPHRSVHVLVFDSAGRLLLQRRHAGKMTYPRCWDVSCSGHVDEEDYDAGPDDDLDRVYERAARRELQEELGVSAPIEFLLHIRPIAFVHYEQIHLYRATHDGPIAFQRDEIEEVRWVAPSDFDALVARASEPKTRTLPLIVERVRSRGLFSGRPV